ncbi:hypothetical protein OG225_11015 [Nocardia sp. NBC_01377]|uniref:VOC family protein n=1 Tax=Nocardia sp. NBC_01377 TaxID=2903595 RepID=UPI0032550C90
MAVPIPDRRGNLGGGRGDSATHESSRTADHLVIDLVRGHLAAAEAAAIECGAVEAEFQPAPDRWRVLIDPSGHPFRLTVPPGTG